jgi:hypothetical protein
VQEQPANVEAGGLTASACKEPAHVRPRRDSTRRSWPRNGSLGVKLLILCLVGVAWADEATPTSSPRTVIERFAVLGDGDGLLLPVRVKGRQYQFLLDTGCSVTAYDLAIPLGEAQDTMTADSPTGRIQVQLFDAPDASLGRMTLRGSPVVPGIDLRKVREVSGQPVYGVVGMDFLRNHVVRIDPVRGEVLFLKSATRIPAAAPLVFRRGLPFVSARVAGSDVEAFLVDTGIVGQDSGSLSRRLLKALLDRRQANLVGRSLVEGLAGTQAARLAELDSLSLGGLRSERPIFGEAEDNALGLGYWSRFVVTSDFPAGRVYLERGKAFGRPDRHDLSGLHLVRREGKTRVHAVDKDSPAATSGIQAGDTLVTIAGEPADRLRLFELRRQLSVPVKTLSIRLERRGVERQASLVLNGRP